MASEQELIQQVKDLLADAPKGISCLAGAGLGKSFNDLFNNGKRKNNGSFKKWIGTIEGVEISESSEYGGNYCVWLSDGVSPAGLAGPLASHVAGGAKASKPLQVGHKPVGPIAARPVGKVGGTPCTNQNWEEWDAAANGLPNTKQMAAMASALSAWMNWEGAADDEDVDEAEHAFSGGLVKATQKTAWGGGPPQMIAHPAAGGKKRKAEVGLEVGLLDSANMSVKRQRQSVSADQTNICWDFVKNNCKLGDACPFDHAASSAALHAEAYGGSFVKGRTNEEREAAKREYRTWAQERLLPGQDPVGQNAAKIDWWYCQVCLCCLKECDFNCYVNSHMNGAAHKKAFMQAGGFALKPGLERPHPDLTKELAEGDIAHFIRTAGFHKGKVLSLGEQDYSFSMAIAWTQQKAGNPVDLVATSYLAEHDPNEPEVHVKDDGMRAHFSRKSLPSMNGALLQNIEKTRNLGANILHSVDATDLRGTLLPYYKGTYDTIIFPFPRASLQRGVQPKNPCLLRNFFRSVNDTRILAPGGKIGVVLLRTQYPDWDVHCLASEAGFRLVDQATLPNGFYQGREMSGKIFDSWGKIGAEIYMFQKNN